MRKEFNVWRYELTEFVRTFSNGDTRQIKIKVLLVLSHSVYVVRLEQFLK